MVGTSPAHAYDAKLLATNVKVDVQNAVGTGVCKGERAHGCKMTWLEALEPGILLHVRSADILLDGHAESVDAIVDGKSFVS